MDKVSKFRAYVKHPWKCMSGFSWREGIAFAFNMTCFGALFHNYRSFPINHHMQLPSFICWRLWDLTPLSQMSLTPPTHTVFHWINHVGERRGPIYHPPDLFLLFCKRSLSVRCLLLFYLITFLLCVCIKLMYIITIPWKKNHNSVNFQLCYYANRHLDARNRRRWAYSI